MAGNDFVVLTTPYDFECAARAYCYRKLFRRPGCLVQLLQGLGRRAARPMRAVFPDRPGGD